MTRALRIGLVDLDTSHPQSFVPIIRSMGHDVAGVYDSGTIYPEGYARTFADKHEIANVYDSLEQMREHVDAVFIHSCDWDVHVDRARPFVEASIPTFIDKPLAGNRRDLEQLIAWSKQGKPITGGSSLRYCYEVQEWLNQGIAKEDIVYAIAGCGVDPFNYGIHAYAMLHGLLGPGVESARCLGTNGQQQMELAWTDGRRGVVSVGQTAGYLPFYATVVAQKQVNYVQAANGTLYKALLEKVMPFFAGEAHDLPPLEQLAEVELAAIAAKLSAEQDGRVVRLADVPESYAGYDGAAFAASYRKAKFPDQDK